MNPTYSDDIKRMFCDRHRREICHECCYNFDDMNRMMEENAGLRPKRSPVELAAEEMATIMYALKGMKQMRPLPSEEIFANNRRYLKDAQAKLKAFEEAGENVKEAVQKALEKAMALKAERDGLAQAYFRSNPGQRHFEAGGPATQKLCDDFLAAPKTNDNRAEAFTCSYCRESSHHKLNACARCKKVSYCDKECQRAAWAMHKKECIPLADGSKTPKTLPLTWAEVEACGGERVDGRKLEVRAILDESVMRQAFSCKDRVGQVRRVAAYTDSRKIPGLKLGAILRWKNPRFHCFMDGVSGGRIEQEDLRDVTISSS